MASFENNHRRPRGISCFPAVLFFCLTVAAPVDGQLGFTRNVLDGSIPPALQADPIGATFTLSGFESVNLFGGGLNVAIPLLHIGGRGETGYTVTQPISHQWTIDVSEQPGAGVPQYLMTHQEFEATTESRYQAGLMEGRLGVRPEVPTDNQPLGCLTPPVEPRPAERLTRFIFSRPDGSSIEFRNLENRDSNGSAVPATDGKPDKNPHPLTCLSATGVSRGRVFVAADASGARFVLDQAWSEMDFGQVVTDGGATNLPTGDLLFRDGSLFRIVGGRADYIRDRNGNLVDFTYEAGTSGRLLSVADAAGRVVTISYDDPSCTPPGNVNGCDVITYKGIAGATRKISIHYDYLEMLFCDDPGKAFLCPGAGLGKAKLEHELFPISERSSASLPGPAFNPRKVIGSIELPNGKEYAFQYNTYRELYRITLPTGGVIEYDHAGASTAYDPACSAFCASPSGIYTQGDRAMVYRRVTERREKPAGSAGAVTGAQTFSVADESGLSAISVTVRSFDGPSSGTLLAREVHYFHGRPTDSVTREATGYSVWKEGKEYRLDAFSTSGTLLRRTDTVWEQRAELAWWNSFSPGNNTENAPSNDPRITSITTTLDGPMPLVSKQEFLYSNDRINNRTDLREYAYGTSAPGAILRQTHTVYETSNTYTSLSTDFNAGTTHQKVYLPSLPKKIWRCPTTTCAEGNAIANTEYTYDHTARQTAAGVIGHDSTGFGTGFAARGNVTRIRHWQNLPANTWITERTVTYDITGNVRSVQNGNNHTTSIAYTDSYTGSSPPGPTFARSTSVTNPLGHVVSTQYDYDTARVTKFTEANDVETDFFYSQGSEDGTDELDRLHKIIEASEYPHASQYPDVRRESEFAYEDTLGSPKITTNADQFLPGDQKLESRVELDGFGRVVKTVQLEDAPDQIETETEYDGLGRVRRTSNPRRPSDPLLWTVTDYDALGRVLKVTHPDNSFAETEYAGNVTTLTDEMEKVRRNTSDVLGRLLEVAEDPDGLGFVTQYRYDLLDNLTKVCQGGTFDGSNNCIGAGAQTRTFQYNSISRLLSATNPEVGGAITYVYDAVGNLTKRTAPGSSVTDYTYDALNRQTKALYASPEDVYRCYDGGTFSGTGCTASSAFHFAKGRLTESATARVARNTFTYDPRGRIPTSVQAFLNASNQPTASYDFGYTYNADTTLATQTYESGTILSFSYDAAGRPAGVSAGATNYVSDMEYAPHGGVRRLALGNGAHEYTNYNNRLQPFDLRLGTTVDGFDLWRAELSYNPLGGSCAAAGGDKNNGNIWWQRITAPKTAGGTLTLCQTYSYDHVNRLTATAEAIVGGTASWSRTNEYDRFGNRAVTGTDVSPFAPTNLGHFSATTNRITTVSGAAAPTYDLRGNQTSHALLGTMLYDAENRQTSFTATGKSGTYAYDSEGRRVRRITTGISGAGTTWYVYDAFGKLAAEYSSVAPTGGARTEYRTTDHLGSTRVVTDQSRNLVSRRDFYPFGERIPDTRGDRSLVTGYDDEPVFPQLFTAKERDDESGLDYFGARYFGASLGRFTSPDVPLLDQSAANPQSWNLYGYVRNNPLAFIDPTGQRCENGISVDTGVDGQDGNACFETTVTADVAISNPYFNAVAQGVNQAAPAVNTLAEGLVLGAEFATGVPIGLIAQIGDGNGEGGGVESTQAAVGGLVLMDPSDVRFSQDSIKSTFKDGRNVGGLIDELRTGKNPLDVAPIRTVERNGLTFTLDNRRLFAASEAGTKVATRPATGLEILREGFKFTNPSQGRFVGVRGVIKVLTRGKF